MSDNPFKNISAAEFEAAIAKALTALIDHEGYETVVNISAVDFSCAGGADCMTFSAQVRKRALPDDSLPC